MIQVTWLGHSTFLIEGSKRVLCDPFLNDNPKAPMKADALERVDVVAITHDHFDHIADAPSILKRTGATAVATYEVATHLAEEHGVKAEGGNIGGSLTVEGVTLHMVPAWHTAGRGSATGFVIEMDGKKVYHAGDTCLFGDMKMLGEIFEPDVFLCPIGDRFTMGPDSASRAVALVAPKHVIPMHFGTWPPIDQDPARFRELCEQRAPQVAVTVLEPGGTFSLT